ncbi:hypothetical protein TEHN7126_2198 [Tetragenococcus halophilus subsp. halophilus]|uniref:BppU family phage baseplate upper protein n=1 Tax=Tetragenococcus halophilus TaxID=51669 RepID=UPI000CC060F7|nr:BppU family phage baseplate upper protein [Tetragenococcus halophilus]GBD74257.1 hypothetical protein TEHN7125_2417 [Tetragenococcus halophilus subsp. halophilus]GBD76499.1 hypothetical protein TEHN7126_2198 [Tetragenococcus halophilus subsp. halophilus]
MPIRKKGNIKIQTSPNGYRIERTGYTFYSYDKNSAALVFTFVDSDNAPVNLSKADVRLLLISDNGDEFPVDKDDIDVISAVRGTARYVIPENLLGYEGKITGHIYLDFEDGSHTDEGQFTFNIKRSMISNVLPEAGDKYVQDFEDVKERVEQAGDSATKDIEKSKDNAESQIGEYVGEVESAKDSAVEDIDKALPEVEGKLQDLQKEMIVGGRNYIRNSNIWADKEKKSFRTIPYKNFTPGIYVLSTDIEIVNAHPGSGTTNSRLGVEFKALYESEEIDWLNTFYYPEEGETYKGRISSIIEIKDTITWIGSKRLFANEIEGDVVRVGLPKLARGNVPTDWSPAIEDYDAKIKRLEKAITNLGGSI